MRDINKYWVAGFGIAVMACPATHGQSPDNSPMPAAPAAYGDPAVIAAATAAALAGGTGPFKSVMEVEPGLPTHTVYRPRDLASAPKLPIIVWGNGGCANHGTAPSPARRPGEAPPPPATTSAQLIDAINWAIAENDRPGSAFQHRLDPEKIAVMGQSCGGLQAIVASADPRVRTSVIWNSGVLPDGQRALPGAEGTKDSLTYLHAPVAYISGDSGDIAYANANDDFARITAIPAFRAYEKGVGHSGTYRMPNGGEFADVGVAWLDWQLKGSVAASRWFVGPDCRLCTDPKWVVLRKNIS